ncbi:MAG: hypothetical protein Rhims3KO_18380 [Hyphomicrobiales bacterium]
MPADDVAHTNDTLVGRKRFEIRLDAILRQIGKGDITHGDPFWPGQRIEPVDLAQRIGRIPVCLDVNARGEVEPVGGGQIILRQAGLAEWRLPMSAKPRMPVQRQIPQVMMGIDDGPGIEPIAVKKVR